MLNQSILFSTGVATGSLVGGLIFNRYGGSTTFRVFGVGCLIFCAIHALIMCILNKKSNYGFPSGSTNAKCMQSFFLST
jgi:predicted MFS family arabinose efflux permease